MEADEGIERQFPGHRKIISDVNIKAMYVNGGIFSAKGKTFLFIVRNGGV